MCDEWLLFSESGVGSPRLKRYTYWMLRHRCTRNPQYRSLRFPGGVPKCVRFGLFEPLSGQSCRPRIEPRFAKSARPEHGKEQGVPGITRSGRVYGVGHALSAVGGQLSASDRSVAQSFRRKVGIIDQQRTSRGPRPQPKKRFFTTSGELSYQPCATHVRFVAFTAVERRRCPCHRAKWQDRWGVAERAGQDPDARAPRNDTACVCRKLRLRCYSRTSA